MPAEPFTNYFNYFTEIEEHFQCARGTGLFLLSPLDWALIESWKNSGIPLEAVLQGIDLAFEKWHARKKRTRMVNSLAWCAQAVLTEAQRIADGSRQPRTRENAPFPAEDLARYISENATAIRAHRAPDYAQIAEALDRIVAELPELSENLEVLEQRLTVLEQSLIAIARARQTEAEALTIRKELDSQLRPWRSKMTAPQIAMLETQYLDRSTLEMTGLPRLSLFYLK